MDIFSNSLCELCQIAFESVHKRDSWQDGIYYTDIKRLRSSATAGCILCTKFIEFSTDDSPVQGSSNPTPLVVEASLAVGHMNWRLTNYLFDDLVSEFQLIPSGTLKKEQENGFRHPSSNTKDALPLCKIWLGECLQEHNHYDSRLGKNNPTRLIYLPEGKYQTYVQLVESHELETGIQYATLSHCWGKKQFLKLLKHNFNLFRHHILFEDLPKTFQDTMNIATYLGIHYVWIDSLCIIQDDEEDWRQESLLMASVYGNSLVNIAASDAVDGSVGCFFNRDDKWNKQIGFKIGDKPLIFSCIGKRHDTFLSALQFTQLASRGWTIQERILSPRTIHFTKSEVFWECGEIACENFPNGIPSFVNFFWLQKNLENSKAWYKMVGKYSSCRLSFDKDKLVAIGGLAKHAQRQLSDDYLVGHWSKDLVRQLVWETANAEEPSIYTAPSWSWASKNGIVDLHDDYLSRYFYEICAQVEKVEIDYITDPFGAVTNGRLRLNSEYFYFERFLLDSDNWIRDRDESLNSLGLNTKFDMKLADGIDRVSCFVMPLLRDTTVYRFRICGLILQPTLKEIGEYRRVGMFSTYDFKDETIRIFDDYIDLVFENNVTESDCVEIRTDTEGKKEYIIDII